jgi:hypothetical protein
MQAGIPVNSTCSGKLAFFENCLFAGFLFQPPCFFFYLLWHEIRPC